jgi:uncharacterized membrane protein YfcA
VDVGVAALLVALTAVLVGSIVQGAIGFGLNMLAAPFVALVVPEALPTSLVLVAFPLTVSMAIRERHHIDRHAIPWLLVGAIPGTLLGLWIVSEITSEELAAVIGAITLIGVALSIVSPPVPMNRTTSGVAGFLSNVFGTAAAIGGPPIGLLFQHHKGTVARSTIATFFAASALLSLVGYVAAGTMHTDQVLFALALLPAMLLGFWLSKHLHPFVDGGWLRPAVLALSAIAGVAALVQGLG